ncbi:hypothetical protein, partial [Rhodanobacter sp. C06]|uniref:hypothetical protein n=1 Tax=Rhodanobacter sp. C06 TaxID=1945854 RepID=UPI0020C58C8A
MLDDFALERCSSEETYCLFELVDVRRDARHALDSLALPDACGHSWEIGFRKADARDRQLRVDNGHFQRDRIAPTAVNMSSTRMTGEIRSRGLDALAYSKTPVAPQGANRPSSASTP